MGFVRTLGFAFHASSMATCVFVASCSYLPSSVPSNVVVAPRLPRRWNPVAARPLENPSIVVARFSTLRPQIGTVWNGEILTSTEVDEVELHTNLYDIAARRTGRGRFVFSQDLIDLPAFLLRAYRMSVIARAPDGRSSTLFVPIRIVSHDAR